MIKRRDPRDITSPEKFYLTTISQGSSNLKQLAEKISYQSTLTPGDCYNVLRPHWKRTSLTSFSKDALYVWVNWVLLG